MAAKAKTVEIKRKIKKQHCTALLMKLSMLYAMRVIVLRNSELISSVVTNNKTKKNRNANMSSA